MKNAFRRLVFYALLSSLWARDGPVVAADATLPRVEPVTVPYSNIRN